MIAPGDGHARRLTAALALAGALAAGPGHAGRPLAPSPDPATLAARASDVRVERMRWVEEERALRPAASARAGREWLERLVATGLGAGRGRAEAPCAVACRRCPEQLPVAVTFEVAGKRWFLSLYLREGLAFVRSDSASTWSFADSLGPVLGLVREALPEDSITRAWTAPSSPPAPLDPDSAAYREDDVLATGLPEPVSRVAPDYPAFARASGISGVVEVQALVAADGSVARVRVAKSIPNLDDAALAAVRAWKFRPATCGGRAVPVWVMTPIRFTLR